MPLGDSDDSLNAPQEAEPGPIAGRIRDARRWLRRNAKAVAIGAAGLLTAFVLYQWATWPDVSAIRERMPESTAFIDRYLERTGRTSAAWRPVPWARISPHLKEAVVVSEDLEFFAHPGFSTYEIEQSIRRAIERRERPRGASTITQQLAKNLWLSPSRSLTRKGKEVLLTRQLEKQVGKRRILEVYLNVVEFGPGVYGAEAAARHYFGRSAAELTQREAAMLAAGLSRPSQWHPGVNTPGYQRRVGTILERMRQVTFLDRLLGLPEAPETRREGDQEL